MDALFESMSGFTTTGATIFTDFSLYSRGLFFWRGLTQWLGGMGVLALFLAILPALSVAGRQLFFAEAPGPQEERLTPRIRQTAIGLWSLYAGLTLVEVIALVITGLPVYDAVCNSFTTMAAGGFSPNPFSIGGYGNPAAEWVIIVFMFLAGANYSLQYLAIRGKRHRLFADEEFQVYTVVVFGSALLLFLALMSFARAPSEAYLASEYAIASLEESGSADVVRHSLFQVLTVITTTGFATDDFSLWSDRALTILLILMFVGGCAGSAAGGPKIVRHWLIAKQAFRELVRAIHPNVVKPVRLGGRVVPPEVMRAITAFMFLYLCTFGVSVTILTIFGSGLITSITASIATLGNIGPGFGKVGPMLNYAHLPLISKIVLFLNMWIGRLEVMTVLVLFQPSVWRTAYLRERHKRLPTGKR
jgi:trk system potassium uptake protein TrkH